jgi:hypothetical protein
MTAPAPNFAHLSRLTDDVGLLEHAKHAIARREHGYCTDDVARGLVVASRESETSTELQPGLQRLSDCYLGFLMHAQDKTGAFHNRFGYDRRWADEAGLGDWWGRALWGLGTAAAGNGAEWIRVAARAAFTRGANQRSASPHSMAFAGLGAAQILRADPDDAMAIELLRDAATTIGAPSEDPEWPWPLRRLTYANAALAEVVITAGSALGDDRLLSNGLRMLAWLRDIQSEGGRLSVTPAGGWRRNEPRERYDQQPIEVAALADACATAAAVTGDNRWEEGVNQCVAWFLGDNDAGALMWDPVTGGGYDGLMAHGPNLNQGAESTLAFIATMQHARRLSNPRLDLIEQSARGGILAI